MRIFGVICILLVVGFALNLPWMLYQQPESEYTDILDGSEKRAPVFYDGTNKRISNHFKRQWLTSAETNYCYPGAKFVSYECYDGPIPQAEGPIGVRDGCMYHDIFSVDSTLKWLRNGQLFKEGGQFPIQFILNFIYWCFICPFAFALGTDFVLDYCGCPY